MAQVKTKTLLLLAPLLALLYAAQLLVVHDRLGGYAECRDAERSTGVVTHWSPWSNACTATVLGTTIRVDR